MSNELKKREDELSKDVKEEALRQYLLGKDLDQIRDDLKFNSKFTRTLSQTGDQEEIDSKINNILYELREDAGDVYIGSNLDEKNAKVTDYQIKNILDEAIKKIQEEEDPEIVISEAEEKLNKLGLGKEKVDDNIRKILDFFDTPEKTDQKEDVKLEQSDEPVPLPKLDLSYDELEEVNLKDELNILPKDDKKTVTGVDRKISEKYGENIRKTEEQEKYEEKTEPLLTYKGKLAEDTRLFTDFIKQVRVCVLTTPYAVRKLDVESYIFRYLNSQDEGRFTRIFIFGWEQQANYKDYKSFNELVEINRGFEGALMIIRDIKTFNVFAVDIFKGVLKNYFLILLDNIVTGEDLAVVENLSNSMSYLYPSDIEIKIKIKLDRVISTITRPQHLIEYRNKIANAYRKPEEGFKESHDAMMDQEEVRTIGRNILNLDLTDIESLTSPGCTLEESLKRSPKFASILTAILSNSDSRMLIKFGPGKFGIDAFTYIYSQLKKPVLKPYVLKSDETFESKKIEISQIPEKGPCLILTDYSLGDVLTPKNIDNFFIAGGGEYLDIQNTVLSLIKSVNYTIDKYPRTLQVTCFITEIQNDLMRTVDDFDYEEFEKVLNITQSNMRKLRSESLRLFVKGSLLQVNKQKVE